MKYIILFTLIFSINANAQGLEKPSKYIPSGNYTEVCKEVKEFIEIECGIIEYDKSNGNYILRFNKCFNDNWYKDGFCYISKNKEDLQKTLKLLINAQKNGDFMFPDGTEYYLQQYKCLILLFHSEAEFTNRVHKELLEILLSKLTEY